jgi:type IX secretion system PorP/SprF family membrane protein
MKVSYSIYLVIIIHIFTYSACAQEIALLSPGLTNSFLYNPSLAGGTYKTSGTMFLANRYSHTQIPGHPRSAVLSASMPLSGNKIGIGSNIFIEKINVFQTIYFSSAFAYNLRFDEYKCFSFGLSADVYYTDINLSEVNYNQQEIVDPELVSYSDGKYRLEFSFGLNYNSEKLSFGSTINSISRMFENKTNSSGSSFYSAYIKYSIPVMLDRDLLEPMVTYRQLPYSKPIGNAGFYYSHKYKNEMKRTNAGFFIGGIFLGTGLQFSVIAGFKVLKRVQLSYSYETSGKYHAYLGPSHEISLMANIIDQNPLEVYNEYLNWKDKKLRLKRNLSRKNKTF